MGTAALLLVALGWLAYGLILIRGKRRRPAMPRVEFNGTVDTFDLAYVQAWLDGIKEQLQVAHFQYIATGYITANDGVVHWTVAVSDPWSTRDELAAMVGNVIDAAGAVPG